jgi:sarcosine oxidase
VLVADEVLSVRPVGGDRVEVRSGGSVDRFERVVVCAGRGTAALARGVGLSLPVRTSAHVRATFRVRGEAPTALPCLQDSSGAFGEAGIYAAPVAGNRRYAVGLSAAVEAREDGTLIDPDRLAELADRAAGYVSRALPGLDPRPVEFRHCWATELPWAPDGLAVWEHEGLLIVAGHNLFKLAPLLGRRLAAAADGESLDPALRPAVRLGAPPGPAGGPVDEPAAGERTPVADTSRTAATG